ncbi:transporter substrate-binding domain-containing protein [Cedecea neteri]|uniref:response regulator n=1 Tax=Cedecea neteri TaxID=158822 RepID=UPI002892B819|nr:transporter substrate-binding domain-containing protein [Cedecea neteri]WNJ78472.1 transporter substrate-binding domain-containing protein [Cedecea neteri]
MNKILTALFTGWLFFLMIPAQAASQALQLAPRIEVNPPTVDFPPEVKAWLLANPIINVGIWGISQPPISLGLENGELAGMDADYLSVLETTLNVRFRLHYYRSKGEALAALSQNTLQMLAVWNPALDTWRPVEASVPWLHDTGVMVVGHERDPDRQLAKLGLLAELEDIAAEPHDPFGVAPHSFQDYRHAINEVAFGQTGMLALNQATARYLTRDGQVDNIWLMPHPAQSDINFSFGVTRRSPQLLRAIDDTLNALPVVSRLRIAQGWGVDDDGTQDLLPLQLSEEEQRWLDEQQPLVVLVDTRRAPFTLINAAGQPDGLAVNVLRLISARYGLKLRYEIANSDEELTRLIGRFPGAILAHQLTIPGEDETARPPEKVSFPWLVSPAVLVMDRHHQRPASLNDLSGERIAIERHSLLIPWLETWYPTLRLIRTDTLAEAVQALHKGQVRGVITSQFAAQYQIKREEDMRLYQALSLPLKPLNFGFGFPGDNPQPLSIFNKALQKITPETLLKLAASWRESQTTLDKPAVNAPSLQALLWGAAGVVALFTLIAFWINHLRHRLRALAAHLQSRQALIEQLQEAKEENEQLVKSRDAFMRSMGHEIRTPLNAIVGLLELELQRFQERHQHNENVQTAYESACSLQMLSNDLIDIFRAENMDSEGHSRLVNLPSLLHSTVALYRQQAEEKGVGIKVQSDLTHPQVECDPLQMIRILSCLLRDAIKHSSSGEIIVALRVLGEEKAGALPLKIEVSNPAWPEASQQHVFSECQCVATASGAELFRAEQDSQSAAVSFSFSVRPFTPATPAALITSELALPAAAPQVLVVDDYPPARLLLRQQLKKQGYQVLTATDGREGLSLWQQQHRHLTMVITDCTMPDMDGFELSRHIRQAEKRFGLNPTPIYGLTAMSREDARDNCLAAGMNDCLTKPLQPETLQHLLVTTQQKEHQARPEEACLMMKKGTGNEKGIDL